MIYNVLFFQVYSTAIHTHTHMFFLRFFSLIGSLQNIEDSSLCYTVGPCQETIWYTKLSEKPTFMGYIFETEILKIYFIRHSYIDLYIPKLVYRLCFSSRNTVINHHRLGDPSNTLKNFYWSIDDLQCCVRFRCTAKWISYTYTHIYPLFLRVSPHVGPYRVVSRVPYAMQ